MSRVARVSSPVIFVSFVAVALAGGGMALAAPNGTMIDPRTFLKGTYVARTEGSGLASTFEYEVDAIFNVRLDGKGHVLGGKYSTVVELLGSSYQKFPIIGGSYTVDADFTGRLKILLDVSIFGSPGSTVEITYDIRLVSKEEFLLLEAVRIDDVVGTDSGAVGAVSHLTVSSGVAKKQSLPGLLVPNVGPTPER